MHRQTPLTAGFVGYTSGGARALVDEINDKPMMQEMKGSIMYGETREKIEIAAELRLHQRRHAGDQGQGRQDRGMRRGLHSLLGRQPHASRSRP